VGVVEQTSTPQLVQGSGEFFLDIAIFFSNFKNNIIFLEISEIL
jgi:hypothetical protein